MPASRAFLTVGTIAVEVARHQQDALGAGGDQLLDRRDLAVVVAVELAGVGLRREPELLGLGLEALLHLDEERVGVGLGDEADDRPVGVGRRAGQREGERRGGDSCKDSGNFGHLILPTGYERRRGSRAWSRGAFAPFGPHASSVAN